MTSPQEGPALAQAQNSQPTKRIYLAYPPNWDELTAEEKEAAADMMAEKIQDALLDDETKARIGFERKYPDR
jgi:hypothetical protein